MCRAKALSVYAMGEDMLFCVVNDMQLHCFADRPTGQGGRPVDGRLSSVGTRLSLIRLPVNNQFPQNDYGSCRF